MAEVHALPAPVELDAIEAIVVEKRAAGASYAEVGKAAGVSKTTAHRIAQRPHVAAALGEAVQRELGDVRAFIRAQQLRAAKRLVAIAMDKETPASVAVPALREILARGLGPAPEAAPEDKPAAPPSRDELRRRAAAVYGSAPAAVHTSARGGASGGSDVQTSARATDRADQGAGELDAGGDGGEE